MCTSVYGSFSIGYTVLFIELDHIVCKSQTGKWLFDYCAAVVGIFVTLKEQKVFVHR